MILNSFSQKKPLWIASAQVPQNLDCPWTQALGSLSAIVGFAFAVSPLSWIMSININVFLDLSFYKTRPNPFLNPSIGIGLHSNSLPSFYSTTPLKSYLYSPPPVSHLPSLLNPLPLVSHPTPSLPATHSNLIVNVPKWPSSCQISMTNSQSLFPGPFCVT